MAALFFHTPRKIIHAYNTHSLKEIPDIGTVVDHAYNTHSLKEIPDIGTVVVYF